MKIWQKSRNARVMRNQKEREIVKEDDGETRKGQQEKV